MLWSLLGLTGFTIFSIGIAIQTAKIIRLQSARDIAVPEVIGRTFACFLMLAGLIHARDIPLIIGGALNTLAMVVYIVTLFTIRRRAQP